MKKITILSLFIVALFLSIKANGQAFTFSAGNLTYNESFDAMGATGETYINGWSGIRASGTGAVGESLLIKSTDGSANSGGVYNVGSASSSERAMGTIGSNSTVPAFGAYLKNNTGSAITKITFSGRSEQWRAGTNETINEIHKFEYSTDATSLNTGTWTELSGLNLVELATTTTTSAALDGNATENNIAINAIIENATWNSGADLWIRWTDDNAVGSDALLAIDDLVITVTTGTTTTLPEPTNYPTNLTVTPKGYNLAINWTDATGAQLPTAYVVLINKQSITLPTDGNFIADDIDLSNGNGAKNIQPGVGNFVFENLEPGTSYNIAIFPYTNSGALVDYKTDGTYPMATKSTQKSIFAYDFENGLIPFIEYSESGDQKWEIDEIHGYDGSACAKVSGYAGGASNVNVDWLISPKLNCENQGLVHLQFFSAKNYAGEGIKVLYSTNYVDGNPNDATWNDVTDQASLSSGTWTWTNSTFISLPLATGNNVRIAFKYTSTATESSTWEIDNFLVTGDLGLLNLENNIKKNYSVYPNPTSDFIKIDNVSNNSFYTISDINGKEIMSNKLEKTNNINVRNLSPGIYFVKITDIKTRISETHKIIVK